MMYFDMKKCRISNKKQHGNREEERLYLDYLKES